MATTSPRVLVVDDNLDSAEMLQELLERQGCRVTTADSGSAAIAACERETPDVVFLDLGLPDIDGVEVGRRLRRMPSMAGSRIVALSGYSQDEHKRMTRAAGFDAHLTKPVDPDHLMAELRRG
jgi:CheY-like chemotaxis protein